MNYPRVLYQITGEIALASQDDLSNIQTETLDALLQQMYRATLSLEEELQKRGSSAVPTDRVNAAIKKLRNQASLIKKRGRVDRTSIECATGLHGLMTNTQSDRNSIIFQEFLTDVIKQCSPQCMFICAVSLGKHKIANLKETERLSLLSLLKIETPSLSVEPFTSLATSYGIVEPKSSEDSLAALLQKNRYMGFQFMKRGKVELLPEMFRSGMKTSSLWMHEQAIGGLSVTNCLSVYLPLRSYEDAFFVTRVSYDWGFHIANTFGLGELDNPQSVRHDMSTGL